MIFKDTIKLLVKAIIIYSLFYFADYLFSLYNSYYINPAFTKINRELFVSIIAILLFKNYWIRVFLFGFIILTMLIEYFYFQYFGTFVQPIAFYQIIFNAKETMDILLVEMNSMIIPITIFLALLTSVITLKKFLKIKSLRSNKLGLILLILVSIYSTHVTYKALHSKTGKLWHKDAKKIMPISGVYSSANYMRAFRYFIVGILPKKILSNDTKIFLPLEKLNKKESIENNNIIFIIGESLRAKQLHMLGYELETTPKLEKVNGIIAKKIYSAGTMTKVSVSSILNRVKYPGSTSQMLKQDNNLFKLAKNNGYKTYFYSWQNNEQLAILQNFMGRKYIDDYSSREMIKKRLNIKYKYDNNLLKMLEKIDFMHGKNFIVLHERGSHATYTDQYPISFSKFKKTYDNTVLYTDYILSSIINYVGKNSKKPTYIIFTSDHGELLHEHGRNGHGWFFSEVYNVPFIYWSNNANFNLPIDNIQTHFDVSNLISGLLGYDVKILKEKDIYINGSDVDALAGFLHIKLKKDGSEISIIKRY